MNVPTDSQALSIDQFWKWAAIHYNCILRAGNETILVFDYDYLHWHLVEEEDELLVVQIIRGKDIITELVIDRRMVMYVESNPQDDGNVLFELVGSVQGEPMALFHFLMSHGYEDEDERPAHKWTH